MVEVGETPTSEGLAETLNLILQQNEALNTTLAHERSRINGLEAEFLKLTNYTNDLERKMGTISSTPAQTKTSR